MNIKEAVKTLVDNGYAVTLEKDDGGDELNTDLVMNEISVKFAPEDLISVKKLRVNLQQGEYGSFLEFKDYEELYDFIEEKDFDMSDKNVYTSGKGVCVFWRC